MREISDLSLEVQARETHEKAVNYFRSTEQFAYKFFIEVKKIRDKRYFRALGRSSFEEYCHSSFSLSSRFVNEKIQIAEAWGEEAENAHSRLGHKKLLFLSWLPADERESFIEENPIEDMTTRELRQAIKEKKQAEKFSNPHAIENLSIDKEAANFPLASFAADANEAKTAENYTMTSMSQAATLDPIDKEYDKQAREIEATDRRIKKVMRLLDYTPYLGIEELHIREYLEMFPDNYNSIFNDLNKLEGIIVHVKGCCEKINRIRRVK